MEITLKIDNKDKKFIAPFISARMLKTSMEVAKKAQTIGENMDESIIDEFAEFEVKLYGNQFSVDDLLDGYPAGEFIAKLLADINAVIGEFDEKIKN